MEILEVTQDTERDISYLTNSTREPTHEAIASATALLEEINSRSNVRFMLTTHFTRLCHNLKSQTCVLISIWASTSRKISSNTHILWKVAYQARGGVQVREGPGILLSSCRANRVLKTIRL